MLRRTIVGVGIKMGLLGLLAAFVFAATAAPLWANTATLNDPADLHIGTGAGTTCATGCAGDPNIVSATGFDLYYNPNSMSNQSPIGNPFYLIVATPIYTGSSSANSINPTAALFSPYSGGVQTGTVTVSGPTDRGTLTSGPLYQFLFPGITANKSFSFVNMQSCDIGTSTGSNACPNSSLFGSAAPLFGKTITGYEIWTYSIGTTNFSPGDLLNFSGTLPPGSYVSAIGINGGTAWDVPFTEGGIIAGTTTTPEPGALGLLSSGLLALAIYRRRIFTSRPTGSES